MAACTWSTSKRGGRRKSNLVDRCCKNAHGLCAGKQTWEDEGDGEDLGSRQADVAVLISGLRQYLATLDADGKRAFVAAHTDYAGYRKADEAAEERRELAEERRELAEERRALAEENKHELVENEAAEDASRIPIFKQGQRLYSYLLPNLHDLKRALRAASNTQTTVIPTYPLRRVCTKWFFFVTALCYDKVYDNRLRTRVWTKGAQATARDLDIGVAAKRSKTHDTNRSRPMTASTVMFLMKMAEISTVLPNEDKGGTPTIVLPSRTALSTHQILVFEAELRADCPWAKEQMETLYSVQRDAVPEEAVAAKLLAAGDTTADGIRKRAAQDRADEEEEDRVEAEFAAAAKKMRAARKARKAAHALAARRRPQEVVPTPPPPPPPKKRLQKGRQTQKRSAYRYNNKLCGLKSLARPELATIPKYEWFCQVWNKSDQLAHIICRSYLPFAKCTICVRQRSKDAVRRNQAQRDQDLAITVAHLEEVAQEKLCYYIHRDKGRNRSKAFMSMIIDGADQSKYDLPYWCEQSHASDETKRLKMHLYGVLVHGRQSYVFVIPDHEKQGHNSTIQCLWKVIVDQYFANGKQLPPVLFVQLDNTTKQNKGRYVNAFLCLLIHFKVFTRIYVCFLPVGHTHEDIDQMFSRFAIALRGRNMLSRDDMTRVLEDGFTFEGGTRPKVEHWDRLANISDWLKAYITLPQGVMRFRHFRFGLSEAGQVMVQVRTKMRYDMEEDWRGIRPNTNRTFMFTSNGYGIPDLQAEAFKGAIPRSIKRLEIERKHIKEMYESLAKLEAALPTFQGAHVADCRAIVNLYEHGPLLFNWNLRHIKEIMGAGRR